MDISHYYSGLRGGQYFDRQNVGAARTALYNHSIFAKYISSEDTILDFGCGAGHLLRKLPGKRKVGVDINPAALAVAQANGLESYASLADISGSRFSRIITSHAIEHVPNPHDLLVELRTYLLPGGLLVWLSPMDDWRSRHQRVWKSNDFDMHLYSWTPLTIGNLVTAAGYEIQSVETITHAIPPRIGHSLWRLNSTFFILLLGCGLLYPIAVNYS